MAGKDPDRDKVRNIGISAHIDSGKTTLSERILFYTDRIHKIEEVKGKSGVGATMDHMDLEREKGITIQSAATYCTWGNYNINLIDTPGHVDFTVEVERSLRVLDGAIMVLCGVSGVQSQSITVDRQMKRYNVPRIAFINKLDRPGANPIRVTQALREKLGLNAHMIAYPIGLAQDHQGVVDLITMKAIYFDGDNGEKVRVEDEIPADIQDECKTYRDDLVEAVSDFDDEITEKFLEGEEVGADLLKAGIRKATLSLQFVPVMMGSAYKNKGVQPLLDAVVSYLPSPLEVKNAALDLDKNEEEVVLESKTEAPFVGLAFKLDETQFGQLTYIRVYQGRITKGDFIHNTSTKKKTKVSRMGRMHASDMEDIETALAGDIIALFGIDCSSGDTFTDGQVNYSMTSMHIAEPVISISVEPKGKKDQKTFSKALNKFMREDPTFRVKWDEEAQQTVISGMGELHLDVYCERIKREFNCEVVVGRPQVRYRETVTKTARFDYTHKKQTGGSGQFGQVVGQLEPLPLEAEIEYEFEDKIIGGKIPKEYIGAVDKGFREAMKKGRLIGFPVVGAKIVLDDGKTHTVDSSEMAFRSAALGAFREVYARAEPCILEPIMKLEVNSPEEFQGNVIGQISQRRGVIVNTTSNGPDMTVEAEVPLAEMFGYSTDLRSCTQGKAEFTMEFLRYAKLGKNLQEELVKAHQEKEAKDGKKSASA